MNMRWSMGHIGWNEPLIPRMSYSQGFPQIMFLFEQDCLVECSIHVATSTLYESNRFNTLMSLISRRKGFDLQQIFCLPGVRGFLPFFDELVLSAFGMYDMQ